MASIEIFLFDCQVFDLFDLFQFLEINQTFKYENHHSRTIKWVGDDSLGYINKMFSVLQA